MPEFRPSLLSPSDADIAQLRQESIAWAKQNPDCITHWQPVAKKLGVPVPQTTVIELDQGLADWMMDTPDEVRAAISGDEAPSETLSLLMDMAGNVRDFGRRVGFPLFLRNSLFSDKSRWKSSCLVSNPDRVDIARHILAINESWGRNGDGRALYMAASAFIASQAVFEAFDGVPVCEEFEVFARNGTAEGWQPYWMDCRIEAPSDPNWRSLLKGISVPNTYLLDQIVAFSERVTAELGGYWCLHYRIDGEEGGPWLIDMSAGDKRPPVADGYHSIMKGEGRSIFN